MGITHNMSHSSAQSNLARDPTAQCVNPQQLAPYRMMIPSQQRAIGINLLHNTTLQWCFWKMLRGRSLRKSYFRYRAFSEWRLSIDLHTAANPFLHSQMRVDANDVQSVE